MRLFTAARLVIRDFLRHNRTVRLLLSGALQALETFRSPAGSNAIADSLRTLALAGRLTPDSCSAGKIERDINDRLKLWSPAEFDWERFFPESASQIVQKAIILKRPVSPDEKGVLFVAFEDQWLRLLRHAAISPLARDYHLVLSPTWSPPYDLAFSIATRMWPNPLFTILSNFDDIPVFSRLFPTVRVVRLLASSWVNANTFAPDNHLVKEYDIVMLANFAAYKRHFALFRALRDMNRRTRVLLLGRPWGGRNRSTLEDEARAFGVLDRITIMEGLSDPEMIRKLQSAKVSVILSTREGACVAVVESLFANVPVGLLRGASVGSRAYINAQTGRFLRPERLSEDLTTFVAAFADYQPRRWAVQNGISCRESSDVLNSTLKSHTAQLGHAWTQDIVPMQWRPNATFLNADDAKRMKVEYHRFASAYGVRIQFPE